MSDIISLSGLRVFGHHGVLPEEREQGQTFVIDVKAWVDIHEAAASDDLSATLNYAAMADAIATDVATNPVNLLETLAERIARIVLNFYLVEQVEVTVHKPDAPVGHEFSDVAVTIVRSR